MHTLTPERKTESTATNSSRCEEAAEKTPPIRFSRDVRPMAGCQADTIHTINTGVHHHRPTLAYRSIPFRNTTPVLQLFHPRSIPRFVNTAKTFEDHFSASLSRFCPIPVRFCSMPNLEMLRRTRWTSLLI